MEVRDIMRLHGVQQLPFVGIVCRKAIEKSPR